MSTFIPRYQKKGVLTRRDASKVHLKTAMVRDEAEV